MFGKNRIARIRLAGLATVVVMLGAVTLAGASVRTPALSLPGDAALAAATGTQQSPFVVQGGNTTLAVWSDNRANSTGGYEGETSADIYGMRFDAAGNALDTLPLPLVARPASQEFPRAAWNGTNWLLVYESYDLTGTGGYYQKSLEAVRVSPAGQVLDARPIKIYNVTPLGATWAVASDGSGWVIAIQGTAAASADIVASRVSAAGVLLDPGPKTLVPGTYYLRGGIHLAYAGGVFLLAYEESMTGSDPTRGLRFDAALNLLDPAPFDLLAWTLHRLASNGSGFYAVWNEQLPDFTMAIKGTRISTAGQKLDGAGVNISGGNPPDYTNVTGVCWDGTNWRVSWGAAGGLRVARVSAGGAVLDPGGVLVAGPKPGITASPGNGSVQIAWAENGPLNSDVYSANVSSSNVAGPTRIASLGAPAQVRPDVAIGSNGSMIVYRSVTATRYRVLAHPLDAAGNPLTSEPVELASEDGTSYPGFPAVAFNGSVYMVAWGTASTVSVRRIAQDGTVLDPAPIVAINTAFGPVDIEALGGDFLVVGLRCGITCQYINPLVARVRGADGVVLDPSPIQVYGTYSSTPIITTLGGRWLVVFRDNWTHDECGASTVGIFVDAAGVKSSTFSIHGPYSSCGGNGIFTIGLASSGNVALMVQSQELTSGVETDLLARRIMPDGTVMPYVNLTPWNEDQYRPRVAWDGSRFLVVWQDQRDAFADLSLEQLDARSDLFGMRITEGGSILDPQGFVLSNSPFGEAYPNVAAKNGVTIFAASIVRNAAPLANYRIGYERLDQSSNLWPAVQISAAPTGGDVPLSVSFGSAGTSDPEGTALSYAWDFGDGGTSDVADPVHLYAQPGQFLATLTVTDAGGARTIRQASIRATVPNIAPIAKVTPDRTHGPAPLDVSFSSAGSYDPDGFVGNMEWDFGDGSPINYGTNGYHTYYDPGSYTVTLKVFDARGGVGTATTTITVDAPLPPATPTDLLAIAFDPQWINMTWTDTSNNEDGFKVDRCQGTATYCAANPGAWSQVAQVERNIDYYGDTGLPSSTTFSYRVRAFNVSGQSAWSNVSTATTPGWEPVASFFPSVWNGAAPLPVTFDGRGSSDRDGTITSYSWSFGDGATGSGAVVTHTYALAGWYYPSLTVTDNSGRTNTMYGNGIQVVAGNPPSTATGDAGTTFGGIQSGSYLDTRTQNDVAEVLIEGITGSTPSTRKSQLEHKWSLTAAAGTMQTFFINAWHTPNSEGDDFVFEYSKDNITWTPMLTVTKTTDDDSLQSYAFPSSITGALWIRVRDLDRTAGRGQADRVSIDEMFVASSPSTAHSGEAAARTALDGTGLLTVVKGWYGQLNLDWGASCVASDTDYAIYKGTIGGTFRSHMPLQCSTGGTTSTTINTPEGNVYFLVVPNDHYFEGRYGRTSAGAEIPAGASRCWPAAATAGCP